MRFRKDVWMEILILSKNSNFVLTFYLPFQMTNKIANHHSETFVMTLVKYKITKKKTPVKIELEFSIVFLGLV